MDKFTRTSYFGMSVRTTEVFKSYRLLQTVLFLTDSIFRVLFAYFNASMASMCQRSWNGGAQTFLPPACGLAQVVA